ncbi:MAG: DNA replication and repair protein RecF [Desulfovibrio sp.]
MIQIESITIKEFRGIRDLTLEFKKKNFAICGPNGTGKSGIVDAIEFVLTGEISRLTGKGTKEISVKQHGPHVDKMNNPEQASVEVCLFIPSINKQAKVFRTVKNSTKPTIYPDTEEIKAILDSVKNHPEFTLTRRELIRYILAEPGERSQDVQALLRLSDLDKIGAIFTKLANSTTRDELSFEQIKRSSVTSLLESLDIPSLTTQNLLNAVNSRREILNLPKVEIIETTTSIKDGLLASTHKEGPHINKISSIEKIKIAKISLLSLNDKEFKNNITSLKDRIFQIFISKGKNNATKEDFLAKAIDLFDGERCPACDTPWTHDEFIDLVRNKLESLKEFKKEKEKVEIALSTVHAKIGEELKNIYDAIEIGNALTPKIEISNILIRLKEAQKKLENIRTLSAPDKSVISLEHFLCDYEDILQKIIEIESVVQKIPDQSKQDSAREYLIVAQERLDAYRKAARTHALAAQKKKDAITIRDAYNTTKDKYLESIYQDVEKSFSEMYRFIHNDDEGGFSANLLPSMNKLGFNVDFYGRGHFPPGAFHSEGHQDGMGLCLYLALMEYLLKENFTLAVLDDVLMSVDAGHRRAVSRLLQTRFHNTQFIITTHDEIWLKHMRSEALISSANSTTFRSWDISTGPARWDRTDIWEEIDDYLEDNNVRGAAALLRNYLEYISKEICHQLRAPVEFRGDALFSLNDVLPSAATALKKHFQTAKASAQSWGKQDVFNALEGHHKQLTEAVASSEIDKWQINVTVHYNEWVNLTKNDFTPVVDKFKALLSCFMCHACGGLLRISPAYGGKESLRCPCSEINFNLLKK